MSNVMELHNGPERRRRNPFAGSGRHRRTPEAWAEMRRENDALKAAKAAAERDSEFLRDQVEQMGTQMRELLAEVKQMRSLMGADPNQNTVTILPPVEDPEKTQPIAAGELFADGDPMAPLRPKIRIGTIGSPAPSTPSVAVITPSEMVKHVGVTQPIPLWDSPLGQGWRAQRHTA